MKVRVEYRYKNDNGYCRDFVCEKHNLPKPGMKVRALIGYATLVEIKKKGKDAIGRDWYLGYIVEDNGKSSNGQLYDF